MASPIYLQLAEKLTPTLFTSTIFYALISLALYFLGQKTFQNSLDVE